VRELRRRALVAACVAALAGVAPRAPAAHAQSPWAGTAYEPSEPVHAGALCVVHAGPDAIHAYSALAQRWNAIAPASDELLAVGDALALVRSSAGVLAWSALLNRATLLALPPEAVPSVQAQGELGLVRWSAGGVAQLAAYSARTNAFAPLTLQFPQVQPSVALASGALLVSELTRAAGFSARSGAWTQLDLGLPGFEARAAGESALLELPFGLPGQGGERVLAYSAVRGAFSVSPPLHANAQLALGAHVAGAFVSATPGPARAAAWSTFSNAWTSSPIDRDPSSAHLHVASSFVRVDDAELEPRYEAFGALPGSAFVAAPSGSSAIDALPQGEATALERTASNEVLGFSGLRGTGWVARPAPAGQLVLAGPQTRALSVQGTSELVAFSPASAQWTEPLGIQGQLLLGAAVSGALYSSLGGPVGWSVRAPNWSAPAFNSGNLLQQLAGDTWLAWRLTAGPGTAYVQVYDERARAFLPALFGSTALELAGSGNALVLHPGASSGPVRGYSPARGTWSQGLGIGTPLAQGPFASGNVAWLVDAQQVLWAFSATNALHAWSDWPSGSGIAAGQPPIGPGAADALRCSMRGTPGSEIAFLHWSPSFVQPGLALSGIGGSLSLDPANAHFYASSGLIDADGLREFHVPFLQRVAPGTRIWLQALVLELPALGLRFAERAEPVLFF